VSDHVVVALVLESGTALGLPPEEIDDVEVDDAEVDAIEPITAPEPPTAEERR
jgi:hypothetical protein